MPEPVRIDPERLAALIDGRLSDAEAAEVRALLAQADADTLAAYADAVAIAGEVSPTSTADVRPITAARALSRRRWFAPVAGLIAAGLVAFAVLRPSRPDSSAAGDITRSLGAGTLGVPAWGTVRAGEVVVSQRGRAVRMGVLLVQHELASRGADSAAADRAAMVAALLDGVPGGAAAAARWRAIAAGSARPTAEDARVAESFVDPEWMLLGEWLEGARTAASSRNTGWFSRNDTAPLSALPTSAVTAAERELLAAVGRAAKSRPPDFATVASAAAAAEEALGR